MRAGSRTPPSRRSDCSIENATISEYDGSLPTSVMSVPCSVVTTRGAAPGARRGQHLPREERRRRVRHGVVRVDDVEAELARHLHDPVGQRQQILRLAKQRIGRRQHLVKRQPRLELAQPERRFRADEVHLVAAAARAPCRARWRRCRCRRPTRSRRCRCSSDAFHVGRADVGRTTGCLTTKPSANATPASAPNCASRLSMSC